MRILGRGCEGLYLDFCCGHTIADLCQLQRRIRISFTKESGSDWIKHCGSKGMHSSSIHEQHKIQEIGKRMSTETKRTELRHRKQEFNAHKERKDRAPAPNTRILCRHSKQRWECQELFRKGHTWGLNASSEVASKCIDSDVVKSLYLCHTNIIMSCC